jgi:hypothetical protein
MRKLPSLRILLCTMLFVFIVLTLSTTSFAQVAVGISVSFGPPPLPVYDQPICPGEGYIWTPGYWAWDPDDEDYYWVPGTWVLAPEVGFLWTPPWWGWSEGVFLFHEGWWGPHVGFYGGIVYGYGYFGEGFVGGRWDHDHFFYNRSVTNINVVNIHNVYNETVNVRTENHVSFNGGSGGIQARPRPEEERAAQERHIPPVPAQTQHFQTARTNPQLHASANQGKPPIAATARPAEFHNAVPAKQAGGSWNPPANRGGSRGAAGNPATNENRGPATRAENNASRPPAHPNELPPMERRSPPNTGDPNRDRKYQQQQEKLFSKQNQERQKLQQQQEQEHQRLAQQNAADARKQQVEQRHQQQTQQLQQRHVQQQQHLQERQQPPPPKHK